MKPKFYQFIKKNKLGIPDYDHLHKSDSRTIMNKLTVGTIFFIFGVTNHAFSQDIDFCGIFPIHTATSSSLDSIYFDRFGNSYDLYVEELNFSSIATCPNSSGYFELTFIDIDEDLQPVFCKVFSDLSELIPQRINNDGCMEVVYPGKVKIEIKNEALSDENIIMGASARYSFYNFPHGCNYNQLVLSYVEKKIKGGNIRNYPSLASNPDGDIVVNSNYSGTLHTDWTMDPSSTSVDAYSIILHEALHIIGVSSSIALDGTGGDDGYHTWDYFLHSTKKYEPLGGSTTIERILVSDCIENCWSINPLTFNNGSDLLDALIYNCSTNGDIDFVFGANVIAPIAGNYLNLSILQFDQGYFVNCLSHLNTTCNGQDIPYVMQPFSQEGPNGVRRHLTSQEIEILCTLGYQIESCDECFTASNDETENTPFQLSTCCELFFTGCVDEEIEIPLEWLLCNDFSNGSLEITDAWALNANTSVSLIASSIKFTPHSMGQYRIAYTVKGCDCFMLNSFINVYVGPCTDCETIDPCENLVCLETFEEYDPNQTPLEIYEAVAGVYWSINESNTVDICEDENGNNYLHIGSHEYNREGLAMHLSEPIIPECTMDVSFDASTSAQITSFNWYLSTLPPCPSNIAWVSSECQPTNCGTYQFNPTCIPGGSIQINDHPLVQFLDCASVPNLQNHSFTFYNNLGLTFNYLILIPEYTSNSGWNNYIDNIIVTSNCINLEACFDYELIEECLDVEFSSCDQNTEISHLWDFGDQTSSTSINPTHTYSNAGNYNVTHTLTDACGNSESVVHEITVGNCCLDYVVATNTFWTTTSLIPSNGKFHTLTIQHGYQLIVGPGVTLQFCPGGSIIIEQGALLRTKGTFTSFGDLAWQGIYVTGIPNVGQKASYSLYPTSFGYVPQGSFWAEEGSIIENAIIGVRNYGIENSSTGGIIKGTNAIFRNNSASINFRHYQNINSSGSPIPSISVFTLCQFINTVGYSIDTKFLCFIKLYEIDGIHIWGCTFDSDLPINTSSNFNDFGKGIHAIESEFAVQATNQGSSLPCVVHDCGVKSSFNGLAHGVLVENKTAVRPYKVINCVFENCYRGISSNFAPGATILFNEFKMGHVPNANIDYLPKHQIGIVLASDHSGFELQDNNFSYDEDGTTTTIGIESLNMGVADHIIRRNSFSGIHIAHEAAGENAGIELFDGGLVYLCENVENTPQYWFDFLIPNGLGVDLIYHQQGEFIAQPPFLLPSGNKFAHTAVDFHNSEISAGSNFTYYFYNSGTQKPLHSLIGYTPFQLFNTNSCAQSFCAPPCMDGQGISDLKNDYYEYRVAFKDAIDDYNFAISEADSTIAKEKQLLASYFRGKAFNAAYLILAHSWIDTLNFSVDTLIKWYGNLDTYGGDIMMVGELAKSGRMSEALDKLYEIDYNRSLSPTQQLDLEKIKLIYSILDTTNIENLTVSDRVLIRNIAQSDVGISSSISRAMLSYFNEDIPLPYYLGEYNGPAVRFRGDENKLKEISLSNIFSIHPNPASNAIVIDWIRPSLSMSIGEIYITDLYGRSFFVKKIKIGESIQINLAGWNSGLFFATIRDENGKRDTKIFVVY